jgi:hypothetical protein
MKFVVDFEMSLTQDELDRFSDLSKQLNMDFAETVRKCMTEKCEEYLDLFKNNVPDEEK